MPGPWEKYGDSGQSGDQASGPWAKYGGAQAEAKPKAMAAPTQQAKPLSTFDTIMARGPLVEAGLHMGTGMIAKPLGDIAGLTALAKEIISPTPGGGDPSGFKKDVEERLTYQPRGEAGRLVAEYNPMSMLGKGVDWAGGKAEQIIAPPGSGDVRQAVGRGVHEAVNQAPGILGTKYGKQAADGAGEFVKDKARGMMQSALKPTLKNLQTGKATRAVDTLLDEGINVSKGGAEKLQGKITDLNDQIKDKVATSKSVVDKDAVASRLKKVMDDFTKQVTPATDLASIQKAWDEFLEHPLLKGKKDIPVQLAQDIKQGTYRSLGDKSYGELKGSDIEAQKALARGLKEEIAKQVPEVRKLNEEESKMLNALPMVERRMLVEANKNPVGLGWLSTSPEKMAAFMADRSGIFKSLIARMLNQTSKGVKATGKMAPLGGMATSQAAGQIPPPPNQSDQQ